MFSVAAEFNSMSVIKFERGFRTRLPIRKRVSVDLSSYEMGEVSKVSLTDLLKVRSRSLSFNLPATVAAASLVVIGEAP